ncbi:MAG: cytochrome c [Pseudomonadota bacterium]|nr:cytochrome c [Pseudomonadota bacterium]
MVRRLLIAGVVLAVIAGLVFWFLTSPKTLQAADLPQHQPDLANGERMFWAGGCAGCHSPKHEEATKLAGGIPLKTPFGTFYAPNISPHPEAGIGRWSELDFVNAMLRGVSPDGAHYFPAFPYLSYQRMRTEDVLDLFAYLKTLEPIPARAPAHDIGFPFNIRRGLGLWKLINLDGKRFAPDPQKSELVNRGAYLVEGAGHCGECHTPRNLFMGLDHSRWLAGGVAPEGDAVIPNITPHPDGIGSWSEKDIVEALTSGFTPDYDSLGGPMTAVVRHTSRLPEEDRRAMAAYLKAVPPIPGKPKAPAKPQS